MNNLRAAVLATEGDWNDEYEQGYAEDQLVRYDPRRRVVRAALNPYRKGYDDWADFWIEAYSHPEKSATMSNIEHSGLNFYASSDICMKLTAHFVVCAFLWAVGNDAVIYE